MTDTVALVRERVASLPDLVRDAPSHAPLDPTLRWLVTGAGGSEGPARVLVDLLGGGARFVPLSCFATSTVPKGDGLVVFSQSLSPNARLAIDHPAPRRVLVTASGEPPPDLTVVRHGPPAEPDLLVRLVGPALATLAAFELAGEALDRGRLAAAIEAASAAPAEPLRGSVSLITCAPARAHGLRWKLLESLGLPDPPVWDPLQIAHGPFQQFYESDITLLALDDDHPAERALLDRLASILVPERHRLLRLRATLPSPWSWFEHDALLNQHLLATLKANPRDLIDWPGKGEDHPLYLIDKPL